MWMAKLCATLSTKSKMTVSTAKRDALSDLQNLFYETVTHINRRDYTESQIKVWVTNAFNNEFWNKRFSEQHFFSAQENGQTVGFASVTEKGYLDFMYVHKDHQGKGVGSLLLMTIEIFAKDRNISALSSDVSVTARPFFLKKGFQIEKIYIKQTHGEEFINTMMTKNLVSGARNTKPRMD
jgi:putative acetyltransferase